MALQKLMWVAWPAFLVACVLEMLVFAVVDPESLHWFGHPLALSNQGIYSMAFLLFWLVSCAAGSLTLLLAQPGEPSEASIDRSED